jgi:hypothetical protein
MKHETIYFEVTIDFPGNDWPVGKPIVLNQYDSRLKEMFGQKKGRMWFEHRLRQYPGIYKEIKKD